MSHKISSLTINITFDKKEIKSQVLFSIWHRILTDCCEKLNFKNVEIKIFEK
jgi:hypothetical protein